jgi:bacillithiol system protein YtxJ
MIKDCQTENDFLKLLADSHEKPVFLFKHSTNCSISRGRWSSFQDYADGDRDADFWRVLVIQDRPTSLHIASETGVTHQSPQAILFYQGQAVWNTSHWSITEDAMTKALNEITSS